MNYTLCSNESCATKDDCLRWKNYVKSTTMLSEQQIHIQKFEPFDQYVCKFKLIRIGNE